jgi:uroporphyrin-III C-methyltransferase
MASMQNAEPPALENQSRPVAAPAAHSGPPTQTQVERRWRMVTIGALAIALGAVAFGWVLNNRFDRIEREFARRIQDANALGSESRALAHQAQDQAISLQSRLGVLEGKIVESQSQQASLEQLYQDLSRTRDDWALAEVEQILAVGSQQLQLAGNVQGAMTALQNADNRLARADKPQFIALRRVLARDMERLKALPSVDLAGNALRIDSLVGMVDELPLLSDERPAAPPRLDSAPVDRSLVVSPNGPSSSRDAARRWFERIEDTARYAAAEAWQQVEELIRVRDVRYPDALLLAPSQSYFVRENLKLRLLNARLALLARQDAIYRADLLRGQEMLDQYFDVRSRQTVAALALLKQIEASNTSIELPTLADSLNAVRNFKAPHEH